MKCVEDVTNGKVIRVSDDEALRLVSQNDKWAYVDKSAWKAQRKEKFNGAS